MEFYETDVYALQNFIANEKVEGEFTNEYVILYDFATDCRYNKCIQPELIRLLLPFYLKTVEKAVLFDNKVAVEIYEEFNSAIFLNTKNFIKAVGEKEYEYIMKYYIELTIRKMEMLNPYLLEGASLFNTTVAFENDNIHQLFHKIFEGTFEAKFSFFKYLSVLLFKESDNLLAVNEVRAFWTSDIWDFAGGMLSGEWFWRDTVVEFFDKEINKEKIETLFTEVKPLICDILGSELVVLLQDEMNQSFATGIFHSRKAEFLKKINCISKKKIYWVTTF